MKRRAIFQEVIDIIHDLTSCDGLKITSAKKTHEIDNSNNTVVSLPGMLSLSVRGKTMKRMRQTLRQQSQLITKNDMPVRNKINIDIKQYTLPRICTSQDLLEGTGNNGTVP